MSSKARTRTPHKLVEPGPWEAATRAGAAGAAGRATFTAYSKQGPRTHKASNVGATPFHNVSFIFRYPQPGRFTPSSCADVPGYPQIMDNERVRGWRLVLEPGQSVAAITQQAPGIRIVAGGGILLAGTGRDPRGPQQRDDPPRGRGVRAEVTTI
jgi:hypothetical protein